MALLAKHPIARRDPVVRPILLAYDGPPGNESFYVERLCADAWGSELATVLGRLARVDPEIAVLVVEDPAMADRVRGLEPSAFAPLFASGQQPLTQRAIVALTRLGQPSSHGR